MSRNKRKNILLREDIGKRFTSLITESLGLQLSQAARKLNYTNPTTLYSVRKGKALPDYERLVDATSKLVDRQGRSMNLHWILTGVGPRFLNQDGSHQEPIGQNENDINIISKLSDRQRAGLSILLGKE